MGIEWCILCRGVGQAEKGKSRTKVKKTMGEEDTPSPLLV